MLARILTCFVMALAIFLLSCSDEQKISQDNQPLQQATPSDSLAAADTTLASSYFTKAEQFAKEAKYDSALEYHQKSIIALISDFGNETIAVNPELNNISLVKNLFC